MHQKRDEFESLELLLKDGDYAEVQEGRVKNFQSIRKPIAKFSFMTVGIFLFFVLDIAAFFAIGKLLLDAKNTISDIDNLEFRNPYVGLDELYRSRRINITHYDTVINEPRFATQISPGQPDEVFPIDTHRWLSDFGLLSPPDRHFQVSSKNEVVTVAQFHILDYGMENCSLKIRLPRPDDDLPHPYLIPSTAETVPLTICEIDAKRPLKESVISWSKRPKCLRDMGIIQARIGGDVEIEKFPCKSGSFIGYQISCDNGSPHCEIDVWTNQNATWGIFIEQQQTLL